MFRRLIRDRSALLGLVIISLLILPMMMGGSVLIQWLMKDIKDTKDKQFAVVNRTVGYQGREPTPGRRLRARDRDVQGDQAGHGSDPRRAALSPTRMCRDGGEHSGDCRAQVRPGRAR